MSNKLTFSCSSCLDCKLFNCRHLAVQEISITCAIQSDIEFIVKTVQEYDQLEEQCPLKKHNEVYFCKMPSLQRTQDESNLLVDDSFLSIPQDDINHKLNKKTSTNHLFYTNEMQSINKMYISNREIHEPHQTLHDQVLRVLGAMERKFVT